MKSGRADGLEAVDSRQTGALRQAPTCIGGPGKRLLQAGYTILEMMIVVALLALIAAIAAPSVTPAERQKLDLATSSVADALRFAREEARRTGVVHGVSADVLNDRLRVFRLDEIPNPNDKVFDVYQPVSKHLYTIQLDSSPYGGVVVGAVGGQMLGACSDPGSIAFDPGGVVRCVEPVATRIRDASIELALGGLRSTVTVDEYAGRVSVQ